MSLRSPRATSLCDSVGQAWYGCWSTTSSIKPPTRCSVGMKHHTTCRKTRLPRIVQNDCILGGDGDCKVVLSPVSVCSACRAGRQYRSMLGGEAVNQVPSMLDFQVQRESPVYSRGHCLGHCRYNISSCPRGKVMREFTRLQKQLAAWRSKKYSSH